MKQQIPTPDGRLFEFFDGTATVLSQHCAIKSINDDLTAGGLSADRNRALIYLFIPTTDGTNALAQYRVDILQCDTLWYFAVSPTHEYHFNYTLLERCAITKPDVFIYIKLIKTSDFFPRIVFISEKYNATRYYCVRKHIVSGISLIFRPNSRKLNNLLKLLVDFLIISIVNYRVQLTLDIKYILWIITELNLKS